MNLEKMKQKKSKNSVKKGLLAATTFLCLTTPLLQTQTAYAAENTTPAITIEKPDGWKQGETTIAVTVDASHMPEGFSNSTNDFVTKVWGNILTKEIITKSVVPDLLKNIDLKQIKILDYAQELCPPDVKGQVYVSESEIMNDRNKTYYKILEHPLYGRMADTGIIGVLTHDGYMEFVVPNCETSVETPDKKEDTHEEEIEKPIVKEIMKIWKEVFEIEDISIQDDFYTLGGDSIILMRLVDEMCKTLGCDVTVDDILQSENISDLANRV